MEKLEYLTIHLDDLRFLKQIRNLRVETNNLVQKYLGEVLRNQSNQKPDFQQKIEFSAVYCDYFMNENRFQKSDSVTTQFFTRAIQRYIARLWSSSVAFGKLWEWGRKKN